MKKIIIFFVLIAIFIAVAGCIQTPSNVEQETKGTLNNVSVMLSTPAQTVVQPTFAPLQTSSNYVQPPVQTLIATPTTPAQDPIVGEWSLYGGNMYDCNVIFSTGGSGSANCYAASIPVGSQDFSWQNTGQDQNQTFMTDYNITTTGGQSYEGQYSSLDGQLYSTMLPAGTYLVRG